MARADSPAYSGTSNRGWVWIGVLLLFVGLLGHVLAAHGTGGRPVDYRHHVAGFFLIALLSGPIIAALGWRFWKGRHDITLLVFGALQALVGLLIYLERYRVAAGW